GADRVFGIGVNIGLSRGLADAGSVQASPARLELEQHRKSSWLLRRSARRPDAASMPTRARQVSKPGGPCRLRPQTGASTMALSGRSTLIPAPRRARGVTAPLLRSVLLPAS